MEVKLFETLSTTIPDGFVGAEENERKAYFGGTPMDYAFVEKEKGAVIGVVRTQNTLADEQVEKQIAAYQQYYSRMAPGFAMGEMRKSSRNNHNIALMTYKSNAPTKDLYNILAITTLDGKELLFLFSCDLTVAQQFIRPFVGVLESLEFADEQK